MSTLLYVSTSLPLAAQGLESGSLAGAVVGACIGTALLYTVVLLNCGHFCSRSWNRRHRLVLLDVVVNLWY